MYLRILLMVAVLALLGACGNSGNNDFVASGSVTASPSPIIIVPTPTPSPGSAEAAHGPTELIQQARLIERKIVKDAQLTLEVFRVRDSLARVRHDAEQEGAYVSNLSDAGQGATVEIKVPASHLESLLARLCQLGRVISRTEKSQDVTDDYVDTSARVLNLQQEEARLQMILHGTGALKDVLEVEKELTRVRGDIEKAQGHLKRVDYQVAWSTVSLTLTPRSPDRAEVVPAAEKDFWDLSGTVLEVWQVCRETARAGLKLVIWLLPLVPWLPIGLWIARRWRKTT